MERYSRQELAIGKEVSDALKRARIGIVGLGGTGSHTAWSLRRMGCGNLLVIDRDIVEESNLARCAIYDDEDVGHPKAVIVARKLGVEGSAMDIMEGDLDDLRRCDIICECLDSLSARFVIDSLDIPWVHSAAVGEHGEAGLFLPGTSYAALFDGKRADERCSTHGASLQIVSIVSQLQIFLLRSYFSDPRAVMYHVALPHVREVAIPKASRPVMVKPRAERICGEGLFQFRTDRSCDGEYVTNGPVTLFRDGRVLIKASSEREARSLLEEF